MATSCYSQYKACVSKCQPAGGYDKFLCVADCFNHWLECMLPKFPAASLLEYLELIEVFEEFTTLLAEMTVTARAYSDAMLSQRVVVKPGGIEEPFLPNSKLNQRLIRSGIDREVSTRVTREIAKQFEDGQSSEAIREMVLSQLETEDPKLVHQFLGK